MGYLPNITAPEMADSPSGRHYHTLMELSASARSRGEHQAAQQYATAAHRWAMDEHARLQQLVQAKDALASATRHLDTIRAKAPDCTTLDELHDYHPEFKRVIVAWERAREVVRGLTQSQTGDEPHDSRRTAVADRQDNSDPQ